MNLKPEQNSIVDFNFLYCIQCMVLIRQVRLLLLLTYFQVQYGARKLESYIT